MRAAGRAGATLRSEVWSLEELEPTAHGGSITQTPLGKVLSGTTCKLTGHFFITRFSIQEIFIIKHISNVQVCGSSRTKNKCPSAPCRGREAHVNKQRGGEAGAARRAGACQEGQQMGCREEGGDGFSEQEPGPTVGEMGWATQVTQRRQGHSGHQSTSTWGFYRTGTKEGTV